MYANVVHNARKYLGVPFKMKGRDKQGLDCCGLLACVGRDCGFYVKDSMEYRSTTRGQDFLDLLTPTFDIVERMAPGDALGFSGVRTPQLQHVGIWTGERVIHVRQKATVTEQYFDLDRLLYVLRYKRWHP